MIRKPYPPEGEIFELTLDGDAPENDPIKMLYRDFPFESDWKYIGDKIIGKQARFFKIVSIGPVSTFRELKMKLVQYGAIPGGQWREALKITYGGWPAIGIADDSWCAPGGGLYFPYIRPGGHSGFKLIYDALDIPSSRWLVEADAYA